MERGYKEDSWGKQGSSIKEPVKKGGSRNEAAVQRGLEPRSREIALVKSCCQTSTSEDIAGWKMRSVSWSD
jgi:hypothetical protein